MLRSLFTSATGLTAQQFNLDVVSHNLANVSTTGFKRSRADFTDMVYQTMREAGGQSGPNSQLPTGTRVGLGVSVAATVPIQSQGTLVAGNGTDMAIQGQGYFQVQLPDGSTGYTRDGSFRVDGTGKLVTAEGYAMQPEITIPPNADTVNISNEGQVIVKVIGQQNATSVGTVQLSTFINPSGLRANGGNIFSPTPASGAPATSNPGTQGAGTLRGGYLEASNVDIVEEMVRMIIIQRAYDANSKSIQAADEMLATTNGLKR
ncbi:MAG: flagellar basal-body rod protein FlgG [Chthonomonadaceae bacterium]|nr:flagellar basal-body rod protein FlgG [Chthonomonadaceae bacterium]